MTGSARARLVLAVAGIALAARLALALLAPAPLQHMEPTLVASSLLAGQGFTFTQYGALYHAWKEPFHPFLLAAVWRLPLPREGAVLALQCACGTACAGAVALWALALGASPARAFLAGALGAINPFLVYYDVRNVHPLSLDVLLFLVSTAAIAQAATRLEARGATAGALAGLVGGAVLWERATLLSAGLGAWVAAAAQGSRGRRLRAGAAWLLVALAVVAPWVVRNALVVGRPVVTTDAAHIFWLGNNPRSDGTYSDAAGRRWFMTAPPELRQRVLRHPEAEQYDVFRAEALRFVREQPLDFVRLCARRAFAFFVFTPKAGLLYTPLQTVAYVAWYAALLSAGALGAARFWRAAGDEERARAAVLAGAVLGLAAVHTVTAIDLKHRVPLEMALSVAATCASPPRRPS